MKAVYAAGFAALSMLAPIPGSTNSAESSGANSIEAIGGEEIVTIAVGESVIGGVDNELEPNATVRRVVDGDTIEVEVGGRTESVRLLGIDTPETVARTRPVQCFGAEASAYLSEALPEGSDVTLIVDVELRDRYDRLLAYVIRSYDMLFVNLDLIENGYADVSIYEPNSHYQDVFEDAEAQARKASAGLWGACGGPDVPLR